MFRKIALISCLALAGCFQDADPNGWGISQQNADTPVPFRQWRVCRYNSATLSLSGCFQTGFEEVDHGYRLTNPQNKLPKSFRLHSMTAASMLFNGSDSSYGYALQANTMVTQGQAYLLFLPECGKVDVNKLAPGDAALFERNPPICKFRPEAKIGDVERIMKAAANQQGANNHYVMFEPGAKVHLKRGTAPSDGSGFDGAPQDIRSRANDWLRTASRKWFVNKYDSGSVSSASLISGDFYSGEGRVRVNYTINGGRSASATVVLSNGKPRCIDYGDLTGCRPFP